MLTNQDIQKIVEANKEIFATKEDIGVFKQETSDKFSKLFQIFATKEDIKEAMINLPNKEDFNSLQTSIDSYAKKSDMYFQEMLLLANKIDRQEKWIHQLAEKMGVQLKY